MGGDGDETAALFALQDKARAIEAEIAAIQEELQTMPGKPGLKGNLVDKEGFPRADVDVHNVRIKRNRLAYVQCPASAPAESALCRLSAARPCPGARSNAGAALVRCLQTDHLALMKQVEAGMHAHWARLKNDPAGTAAPSDSTTGPRLRPHARPPTSEPTRALPSPPQAPSPQRRPLRPGPRLLCRRRLWHCARSPRSTRWPSPCPLPPPESARLRAPPPRARAACPISTG